MNFSNMKNQTWPPSLSNNGDLRFGTKSDLLDCIKFESDLAQPQRFSCTIFDGPALVHSLSTGLSLTFDDYANTVFIPFLMRELNVSDRVDIVWDQYFLQSLKNSIREKRGHGLRRKVVGSSSLPRNFSEFLKDSENKKEFFNFLSEKVSSIKCPENKAIYVTKEKKLH
eukprot:Pompholyxophrys_punicea_v1_NODE_367_length_2146_cov_6.753228.p2 type:complete len:169 gc:universal NODE_367_length_2146_cov_6.753228:1311-805(-)